ncbi:MAG: hypothetical protein AABP62_11950 [Planctomycetota bacterium]
MTTISRPSPLGESDSLDAGEKEYGKSYFFHNTASLRECDLGNFFEKGFDDSTALLLRGDLAVEFFDHDSQSGCHLRQFLNVFFELVEPINVGESA